MSKALKTAKTGCDVTLELVEYDDSWQPWTHCIRRIIDDGKSYERPGLRTCTGWTNYETLEDADKAFSEQTTKG